MAKVKPSKTEGFTQIKRKRVKIMLCEFLTIINENGAEEKVGFHYGSALISNLKNFWEKNGVTVLTKSYIDYGEISDNSRTIEQVYKAMKEKGRV